MLSRKTIVAVIFSALSATGAFTECTQKKRLSVFLEVPLTLMLLSGMACCLLKKQAMPVLPHICMLLRTIRPEILYSHIYTQGPTLMLKTDPTAEQALMLVTQNTGSPRTINALLESDADINAMDRSSRNAYFYFEGNDIVRGSSICPKLVPSEPVEAPNNDLFRSNIRVDLLHAFIIKNDKNGGVPTPHPKKKISNWADAPLLSL